MKLKINLADVSIRTELQSGDIGYVTYLHGYWYKREHNYGIEFESYVAKGLHEFYIQYDPIRNRVWVCEHEGRIVGFILLMDRGNAAQLRYFILIPEYRGIGLGNKLMESFMEFFHKCKFESSYLWTTEELHSAAHLYIKYGFRLVESKPSTAFGKPVVENKYEYRP